MRSGIVEIDELIDQEIVAGVHVDRHRRIMQPYAGLRIPFDVRGRRVELGVVLEGAHQVLGPDPCTLHHLGSGLERFITN